MQLMIDSFIELYPHLIKKTKEMQFLFKYSKKFSAFNANIKYQHTMSGEIITISASAEWKDVDEDIVKGLCQSLYLKLFKKRFKPVTHETMSTHLYETFLTKLEHVAPTETVDPILGDLYNKLNKQYFSNELESCNLIWGTETFRKFGSYQYQTDTITISSSLSDQPSLLGYVLFHEMLHKKHRYYTVNGRNFHHHKAFRDEEKQYPNFDLLEIELTKLAMKKKRQQKTQKRSLLSWLIKCMI
ncbi:MAG: putative metal-dependent hydrolase [Candidatus Woesearchaeota archaeon]|jgi:predicted metal-dependent hydrolase